MTSICVHRAPRTPPDSTPGHISSRDVLQEARRPDTDLPRTALTALSALRARLVPSPPLFCNSSDKAIAILRASRAYLLARWHRFVSIEHRDPLSTALQGTSARAMASICVHRAPRTPPDSIPGHIGSRDDLQEARRTDTELPHTAVRARSEPAPTLSCNSSDTAIAILQASRAHRLARWHRFVFIEHREPL